MSVASVNFGLAMADCLRLDTGLPPVNSRKGRTMTCPTCGTENPAGASYCGSCGVPLQPEEEGTGPVIYCAACGSENSADATACIRCGTPTHGPVSPPPQPPHLRREGFPERTAGDLRPRDLGELLNETFHIYGRNFGLFFRIALISQVPVFIGSLLPGIAANTVFLVIGIVVYIIAAGAAAVAVAFHYLGKQARLSECYGRAVNVAMSLVGCAIVVLIALAVSVVLGVIVVGIVLFFYLLVAWYFYVPTVVFEGRRGPLQPLARSRALVKGSWWRVFGIGVVYFVILAILGLVASIPGSIAQAANAEAGSVLFAVGGAIVAPVGYIGATVVYIDLRVRKEGYTLEAMAREVGEEEGT